MFTPRHAGCYAYADRAGPAGVAGREWRGKDAAGRKFRFLVFSSSLPGYAGSGSGAGIGGRIRRVFMVRLNFAAGNERRKCRVEFAASGAVALFAATLACSAAPAGRSNCSEKLFGGSRMSEDFIGEPQHYAVETRSAARTRIFASWSRMLRAWWPTRTIPLRAPPA